MREELSSFYDKWLKLYQDGCRANSPWVLTIMVPDASQLPADIEIAKYDVAIRLIRR